MYRFSCWLKLSFICSEIARPIYYMMAEWDLQPKILTVWGGRSQLVQIKATWAYYMVVSRCLVSTDLLH